jgi:hypothetical protein
VEDHVVVIAPLRKGSKILASLSNSTVSFGIDLLIRWRFTNLGRVSVVELDSEGALGSVSLW